MNNNVDNLTENSTNKTKKEMLDELKDNGKLTEQEYNDLMAGLEITIGTKKIQIEDEKMLVKELEIGDYVQYGDKLTKKTYTTNQEETTQTGKEQEQTFETNIDSLWRVINKKSNGEVEIVAVEDTVDRDTEEGLYLAEKTGFLNSKNILNGVCDTLYTNSTYGEGRSITAEDINTLSGFDPKTSDYDGKDNYLKKFKYTSGLVWVEDKNEFVEATESNPITASYLEYSYEPQLGDFSDVFEGSLWLASQMAEFSENVAMYGPAHLFGDYWCDITYLVRNYPSGIMIASWEPDDGCYSIKPIVTLQSTVEIDTSDSTRDGKTKENAYILK